MGQSLLQRGALLQKCPAYYKVGQVLQIMARVIQNGTGNLLESGPIVIAKWGRYY